MRAEPIATIYIPYADYHEQIRYRAMKSAFEQTVKVDVITGLSPNTPAILRNAAMKAPTPFVVFLDADDILEPTFIEDCLRAYEQGKYVYTSWTEGAYVHKPNPCPWSANSHHIVTTLFPTVLFAYLGGFNPNLPGHEDADFYMRAYSKHICGVHLDKPLVHRPEDSGKRSKLFHQAADYALIMDNVLANNGGLIRIMGCCGTPGTPVSAQPGQELPGDVLAVTKWLGMRSENGPVSRRMYIGGNGNRLYVDPRDIAAAPHLFERVPDVRELAPPKERVLAEAGLI